jgi:hypothetical protein
MQGLFAGWIGQRKLSVVNPEFDDFRLAGT